MSRERGADSAAADERLFELFTWALDQPAAERDRLLAERIADPLLLQRVRALLSSDEASEETISGVVAEAARRTLADASGDHDVEPRRLDDYELLEEIGRGGMGSVYLATRTVDDFSQRVAIKVVREELLGPDPRGRLRAERQILSRFEHPNIARLLDGGTTPTGSPYLVMEFVQGVPIDRYCEEHGLDVEDRIRLFCVVCEAVHAAHRSLVVHRDLKPSNILIDRHGQPKLLDFGIAKLVSEDSAGAAQTRTLLRALTPEYASPEQVRGEPVTTASDVYSLGAVLYELLAGRRPYELSDSSPAEVERIVCESAPAPPSTASGESGDASPGRRWLLGSHLRGDLDNIALKALAKEPDRRYASAFELAEDLRRHLRGRPVSARPDTLLYRASKFVRRNRWPVLAAGILGVSLVMFALTASLQSRRVARERDAAEGERAKAEAVVDLLIGVFEDSDSTETRGLELTAGEILERGRGKLDDLGDVPAVRSAAAGALGKVYRNLGEYETSHELLERALEDSRRANGEHSLPTAKVYAELGRLARMRGEYAEAESLLRHALAIHRDLLGQEHPLVADDLNNLAVVLSNTNRIDEAERLYLEALAQRRKLLGEGNRDTTTTLGNLGDLYHEKGDYGRARATLEQSIAAIRETEGNLHLDTAIGLNNLAATVEQLGDYEQAESYYRESLRIREALLPAGHPSILKARGNLATLLLREGRSEEALPELARVVADLRGRGTGGVDLGVPLSSYGIALYRTGRLVEAATAQKEAASAIATELGPEHPLSAFPLQNLAATRARQGSDAEAERLYRQVLEMRRKGYDDPHPNIAFSLDSLGSFLLERGRTVEALPLLEEALAQRRELFPASAEPVVESLLTLGMALLDAGDEDGARALGEEAVVELGLGDGGGVGQGGPGEARDADAGRGVPALDKARCLAGGVDAGEACRTVVERLDESPSGSQPSRIDALWRDRAERLGVR